METLAVGTSINPPIAPFRNASAILNTVLPFNLDIEMSLRIRIFLCIFLCRFIFLALLS